MAKILEFPDGFLWGSATSAYQVEGGIENNDWAEDYPAGRACGHYEKYEEDFDLLESLGQNAFRLSAEWARIEPEEGNFDESEIGHYRKVLSSLKSRKISAMLTLHHFTNPLWLAAAGGWESKKVVFYFSRFAEKMFRELGGLVDFWITINEPLVYAGESRLFGKWPPKKKSPLSCLLAVRNQIAAHKEVCRVFRRGGFGGKIGIAKNNQCFQPRSALFADKAAASLCSFFGNDFFLSRIKKELDFIGLNYYFRRRVGLFGGAAGGASAPRSDIGWEIYPRGICRVLKELKKYGLPVYVTENGLADSRDKMRKEFIKAHLFWVWKAITEGVPVKGYFHWSLIDNFEWEKGFVPRFGLAEVDYKTLKRTPRPSAYYYAEICKSNRLEA